MEKLIRPLLKTWPAVERGQEGKSWDDVRDARSDIDAWEHKNNVRLPDAYRRFMLKFNGGRVYPNLFTYTVPLDRYPSNSPITYCDPLYNWEHVEKIWNGEVFGGRNPPAMLMIGSDPGGIEILLSLRSESYGKIYTWLHSLSGWGEEENRDIWLQANSFQEFMDSLYEDGEKNSYEYWYRPGFAHLERKLEY